MDSFSVSRVSRASQKEVKIVTTDENGLFVCDEVEEEEEEPESPKTFSTFRDRSQTALNQSPNRSPKKVSFEIDNANQVQQIQLKEVQIEDSKVE